MSEPSERVVRVWFLVLGEVPAVVVDVADGTDPDELSGMLLFELRSGGLAPVPAFYGHQLERKPPRVAWHLDDELALADEHGERLLRLPAAAVDDEWRERAVDVKGSATYVTAGLPLDETAGPREVCDALDARARQGEVVGGIVGVGSSRSGLPLFGLA